MNGLEGQDCLCAMKVLEAIRLGIMDVLQGLLAAKKARKDK